MDKPPELKMLKKLVNGKGNAQLLEGSPKKRSRVEGRRTCKKRRGWLKIIEDWRRTAQIHSVVNPINASKKRATSKKR